MAVIASPQNPRVKALKRLYVRRHREAEGLTLVEGWRALDGLYRAGARLHSIWLCEGGRPPAQFSHLSALLDSVPVQEVSPAVMKAIAETATPQGVVALLPIPRLDVSQWLPEPGDQASPPLLLVLDGVQDPGNAGTLVRTALAAGVRHLATTPGTVDVFSPRSLRAAAGLTPAASIVRDVDPEALADLLRRRGIATAVLTPEGGLSVYETDWRQPLALVVGSEAVGVGRRLREIAAMQVRIPMEEPVESLNAAVSGAICLYEAVRQRRTGAGLGLSLPEGV